MRFFSALALSVLLGLACSGPAVAQSLGGETLAQPVCFNVINKAPYTIIGTILTDQYMTDQGIAARHRGNFRLAVDEQTEFCTQGPFYEGRKVEMVLRTLVPVFSCKTGITGDILVHGRFKPEGGTETWADCLP